MPRLGQPNTSRSLQSVVSLIRSITWDAATKQLVSFPVLEYDTLHNRTFQADAHVDVAAGARVALPVPLGTGSLDVLASFELPAAGGAVGFGVSVRDRDVRLEVVSVTASATGASSDVVVNFHSGPQPCLGVRGKPPCTAPPTPPPPTNATVLVLNGERLEVRMLVDRPIVEVFVNKGRAAFVSAGLRCSPPLPCAPASLGCPCAAPPPGFPVLLPCLLPCALPPACPPACTDALP